MIVIIVPLVIIMPLVAVMMLTMAMAVWRFHIQQFIDLLFSHQTSMWICNPRKVLGPRLQVQLTQHPVTSVIFPLLGYGGLGIGNSAKFYRPRGTG